MYSIIETYNGVETIIGNVKSNDEFISFIKDGLKEQTYTFHSGTDIKVENVLNNTTFQYGKYAIHNNNVISYLEKVKGVSAGYLYNSEKPEIKLLYTWRIINNEVLFNSKPKKITIKDSVENTDNGIGEFDLNMDKIQNLNLNSINHNNKILIMGARNTGKSWVIRDILNDFDDQFRFNSLIISPSDHIDLFYWNNFNSCIETSFNVNLINQYIDSPNNCAIILDDCLNSRMLKQNQNQELLEKLLQSNKLVIITCQVPLVDIMSFKFDYHILSNNSFCPNKNKLYELLNIESLNIEKFKECLDKLTLDYGCMAICNNEEKLSNKIKYFKAA